MKNKLIYIANVRIPTEKAHGIQIMKMCEAFSGLKVEGEKLKVELVLPWRFNHIKQDPFEYYGTRKNFKITKIPSLDLVRFGKIGFWIQSLSFACASFWYVLPKKADVIYSRDEIPLLLLSPFKKNLVFEIHKLPKSRLKLFGYLLRKVRKIISTNQWKKDYISEKFGAEGGKILVCPNGIDLSEFSLTLSGEEARRRVGLPWDKKIILYTGHLYGWKGADVLAKAVSLSEENILAVFVGGTDSDIVNFKKKFGHIPNIKIIGRKPHSDIPFYLRSADTLVLPNIPVTRESEFETSPIKLFEYMASGTPIVASDLPSIREILNESNAVLVEPDNPKALAAGIKKILGKEELAEKISKQAFNDVRNNTWEKRAERIVEFIKLKS